LRTKIDATSRILFDPAHPSQSSLVLTPFYFGFQQKAQSIEFNIGSPSEWPEIWDNYDVDPGNYFENSMLAYHAKQIWKLSLLDEPVDRCYVTSLDYALPKSEHIFASVLLHTRTYVTCALALLRTKHLSTFVPRCIKQRLAVLSMACAGARGACEHLQSTHTTITG
jgi:hypothetical protein